MAGRRHHTIPQFLSRGFASKEGHNGTFVWLYQKDIPGFEANTRNVAVQLEFYGKPTQTVDDQITTLEGHELAPLVHTLRSCATTTGYGVTDPSVPFLVAHLSTRTAHARKSLAEFSGVLLASLQRHFGDRAQVMQDVVSGFRNDTEIRSILRNTLLDGGIPAEILDAVMAALEPHWEVVAQEIMMEHGDTRLLEIVQELQAAERDNYSIVGKAHNDALAESLSTKDHAAALKAFHWFACHSGSPLILGDSVTVFETTGKRRFTPLAPNTSEILNVYLPLSRDAVLVGKKSNLPPRVDVHLLNKASARCSGEFLISSQQLLTQPHLTNAIGQWAGILSADERQDFASRKLALFQ